MDNATIDLQHQFYDMLMQSQYWSAERMRDYQRSQLTHLMRHAKKNVPFYENRLDAVLKPNGEIDWERWGEIPIVKRRDLIEHREAMQAKELPPGHQETYLATTSGSTGVAVTTTHNGLAGLASRAALFRSHRWHDLDWSQNLGAWFGDEPTDAAFPEGFVGAPWGPLWDEAAVRGRFFRVNRFASPEQALEYFSARGVRYFTGRGKTSQTLALAALSARFELRLFGILGFATGHTDDERHDCQEAFGAKMISSYSSKEALSVGYECPSGTHFHVNEECVLLEIVNDSGARCEPGEVGRVIVTPLYSTAQPLIRYEQGDLATAGMTCGCGRHLQTIADIVGRVVHLFRFPSGKAVLPLIPDSYMRLLGAKYWQFAQVAPLTIEVRYIAAQAGVRHNEKEIVDIVRARTDRDVNVIFRECERIASSHGDKYIQYINETTS